MNFIERYPTDLRTKTKLAEELLHRLDTMTPEKVTEPRLLFLFEYFKINGDASIKDLCSAWIKVIK